MGNVGSVGMLHKGMIHLVGRMERGSEKFHHTTQNEAEFKIYESFIFGIFHLIFPDLH